MITPLLIVVPTLNSYELLSRLKNSLCAQTYSSWRVVFIDGGSSADHINWLESVCNLDSRFEWFMQSTNHRRIFGAMNQGFNLAHEDEWVLFWGSDDWAPSSTVFEQLIGLVSSFCGSQYSPDLIITSGRYVNSHSSKLGRKTSFGPSTLLRRSEFRKALFHGFSPPHQATLFSPSVRYKVNSYRENFFLAADLDYFLRLSMVPGVMVQVSNLEAVSMADSGVSGKYHLLRTREVIVSYASAFRMLWFFPFLSRYFRRLISLILS